MTCDDKKRAFNPEMIILRLGYAISIIVIVGWFATLTT